MLRPMRLMVGVAVAATVCAAASLSVDNEAGSIEVIVTATTQLTVEGRSAEPLVAAQDIDVVRNGDDVRLQVRPRQSPLDLIIRLPLGFSLEASTVDGAISVQGMVHLARLETDTGAILLNIPLRGTRLTLDADVPPPDFITPDKRLLRASNLDLAGGRTLWRLRDRLPENSITYGDYRIKSRAPRQVEITAFEPPEGWPLRFHWDAALELERLSRPATLPINSEPAAAPSDRDDSPGELVFRSDVRMVNLTMAVSDRDGNPATMLSAAHFHVFEGGVEQRVANIQAGDAAFNLVVLLDMSGSAAPDLRHMRTAARRFVDMARPGDRVAIYALTQGMFQVVSPLSDDREALLAAVRNLPAIAGASPLYDIITLAYAQELHQRPDERNALIVISDGLDNQITGQEAPSSVRFRDLKRAAEEMHAIIYPVFLLSGRRFKKSFFERAQERMADLALASGGRMFPADDISDLDPVFPLIEADLRSVYSLGYYPDNQDFDGSWRAVEVSVDEPDVTVRARPGYYAN
ncbi:MAG: VWA domain-containing protein [Acidobacteria bacterium]|nr:VWA domain-containing protein [Acidobacteriota bacterium]